MLKTALLTPQEIVSFTTTNHTAVTDTPKDRYRKRMGEVNHDEDDEWK